MNKALALLLVLAAVTPLTASQRGGKTPAHQALPLFQSELWPGEGEPKLSARHDRLVLHTKPSSNAPRAPMRRVTPGTALRYTKTRVITLKPGIIEVTRAGEVKARTLGEIKYLSSDAYFHGALNFQAMAVQKGEILHYLQNWAEGNCLIKKGRSLYEIEARGFVERSPLKLKSEPVVEWWIRLTRKGKNPAGWLLVSEDTVDLLKSPSQAAQHGSAQTACRLATVRQYSGVQRSAAAR